MENKIWQAARCDRVGWWGVWRKYKAELELNGRKQSCGLVKKTQYVIGTSDEIKYTLLLM
jgi:hypothetical protein